MRIPAMLAIPVVVSAGLVAAPPAVADCTSAGGTTICAQGESRGANTGGGPSGAGPSMPYPCDYDWTCDTGYYGWDVDLDADWDPGPGIGGPGGPGGPGGIGGPGRPGGPSIGGGGRGGGRGR